MILNAPAGRLSFLQPSLPAKAKEKLQTQELFPKDGCLGVQHGEAGKKSPSSGHSVSLSPGGSIFFIIYPD